MIRYSDSCLFFVNHEIVIEKTIIKYFSILIYFLRITYTTACLLTTRALRFGWISWPILCPTCQASSASGATCHRSELMHPVACFATSETRGLNASLTCSSGLVGGLSRRKSGHFYFRLKAYSWASCTWPFCFHLYKESSQCA